MQRILVPPFVELLLAGAASARRTSSPSHDTPGAPLTTVRVSEGRQAGSLSVVRECSDGRRDGPHRPGQQLLWQVCRACLQADLGKGRERGLVYDKLSPGKTVASGLFSRAHEGQQLLYQLAPAGLGGGASQRVSEGNGTHLLDLSVDDQQQVGESNESNNKARVTVAVRNRGRTQPGRAPLRAPALPQ